jgi:hypothetical protein
MMRLVAAIVLGALLVAGCDSVQDPVAALGHDAETQTERAKAAERSESAVYRFEDMSAVPGAVSTLVRHDAGISMTLRTSELEPGHTYTIWWVIFNAPDACVGEETCVEADLFNPDAQPGVHYAAGNVVGGSGRGHFGGALRVGDTADAILGGPLTAPRAAEVHLIVRSHGPAVPGIIPEQIHTFGGGCDGESGGPPGAEGFACFDPQFSVHIP